MLLYSMILSFLVNYWKFGNQAIILLFANHTFITFIYLFISFSLKELSKMLLKKAVFFYRSSKPSFCTGDAGDVRQNWKLT